MCDNISYTHTVNRTVLHSNPVLHNYNFECSDADLISILESEEFYRRMREKEVTEQDKTFIQEFISHAISDADYQEFLKVCLNNELDPYQEIREVIYSTYAKILRNARSYASAGL